MEEIKNSEHQFFDNVMCGFTLPYLAYSGYNAKIFIIQNAIIIIEDYSLNLNKNSVNYSDTYLVVNPTNKPKIDITLFRNYSIIEKVIISQNSIKIKVRKKGQSFFKSIGFNTTPIDLNIKFKLRLKQTEIEDLFKKMNLIP